MLEGEQTLEMEEAQILGCREAASVCGGRSNWLDCKAKKIRSV